MKPVLGGKRGVRRFSGIQASTNIFLGEKIQVRLQLRTQVLLEPLLAEHIPESGRQISQAKHLRFPVTRNVRRSWDPLG